MMNPFAERKVHDRVHSSFLASVHQEQTQMSPKIQKKKKNALLFIAAVNKQDTTILLYKLHDVVHMAHNSIPKSGSHCFFSIRLQQQGNECDPIPGCLPFSPFPSPSY